MRWAPFEISLVSIPADVTVGVGRSQEKSNEIEFTVKIPADMQNNQQKEAVEEIQIVTREEKKMDKCAKCGANLVDGKCQACELQRQITEQRGQTTALDLEKGRIAAIEKLCKLNDLDDRYKEMWISQGTPIDKMADELLAIKAKRAESNPRSKIGLTDPETKRYSIVRAIRAIDQKDWTNAPFELECTRAVSERLKMAPDPNKFYVPYEVLERPIDPNFLVDRWGRRDIAVGTGGGAYLVGVENLGFIELLRNRTVVLKMGATRLTGLVGNVTIPKQSGGYCLLGWRICSHHGKSADLCAGCTQPEDLRRIYRNQPAVASSELPGCRGNCKQ
jgi:hypothetical protein